MSVLEITPDSDVGPNDGDEVPTSTPHWQAINAGVGFYIEWTVVGAEAFGFTSGLWNVIPNNALVTTVEIVTQFDTQGWDEAGSFVPAYKLSGVGKTIPNLPAPLVITPTGSQSFNTDLPTHPDYGGVWTREELRKIDEVKFTLVTMDTDSLPKGRLEQLKFRVTYDEVSILEAISRLILGRVLSLGDITSSKTGFKVKGWQTVKRPPAVYVAPAGETKSRGPTRSKENQVVVTLPTVVRGSDPLVEFFDLYKRIEEVVEADPGLDGLALDAWVSGFQGLVTEEEIANGLHVSDIFVTVDYRHDRGSP